METKKELFANLDKLRDEINSINKDLNNKDNEKESWFRKKEDISKNIRRNISSIKESKQKRDDLTKKVKELKEKRNSLNQEIKKNIFELIKLKNETNNLTKKSKIKNPQGLKGEIDRIEVKLETEAMPFEKEKSLSKKIKQLKKLQEEASIVINNLRRIKKFNSEIDSAKKISDYTHNEIQKLAAESQKLHESLIKNSKEIDGLRVKEEEAFKKFVDCKKNFSEINTKLEEQLGNVNDIQSKINKFQLEEDEKRRLRESIAIKSKEQEISEKIKTGKKITTEDFLMFQEAIKGKKI
ncbi:MAG: hypothetical protein IIC69_00460 [Nanoarchaeota archaeon]|nr:hypothetical protein [Nanoarchaeota archaeon]